jgi:hypothetical protein
LCVMLLQASVQGTNEGGALPEVAITWGAYGAYAFVPSASIHISTPLNCEGAAVKGRQGGQQNLAWPGSLVDSLVGTGSSLDGGCSCTWQSAVAEAGGGAERVLPVLGTLHLLPAPAVAVVVDTVGAGDTFIAATLVSLCRPGSTTANAAGSGAGFLGAVACGVAVASAKVAQSGMGGLSMPL